MNEVTIDGKRFISLDQVKEKYVTMKEYRQLKKEAGSDRKYDFSMLPVKTEAEIHKKLKLILIEELECVSETWALKQPEIVVLDASNVCCFCSNTGRGKLLLRRYLDSSFETKSKMPDLDYKPNDKMQESKYSMDLLLKAMQVFNAFVSKETDYTGAVKIKVKNDFPITIMNDDLTFILAPRVEND